MFDKIPDFLFGRNSFHLLFSSFLFPQHSSMQCRNKENTTNSNHAHFQSSFELCSSYVLNLPRENPIQNPIILENAWTINGTTNLNRSVINGSFSGELDLPATDNNELVNRVDQLEKEVKGRDVEIRELTDRVNLIDFD